ncbi:hypothetical protein CGCF415_v009913 [Colletotrichum fructicola]|uniref:DUF7730 domain-containing protein n=1 Tax=Colletotrichum fructicola (strain Nara gc5) TaxID=1213859 RepID=A0A7J6IIP8_COLFN|nr:hypothetical protein CFRS1_v010499 [Colletotrichum fructicola]KAF4476003.1 hypothetical protein CGGC5_v014549 [Colletotrichum fructicola Nara gc5]KAF4887857.1 hypothetical protein CGCFRS4_v010291 [Colletotrichum fructicola]KAF4900927.1 hypothetical protein CGCF415_v009913 [Colletotrichum fructicola]KAF4934316.1 hypothetical protein CGCF245_v008766 [Colletotrichum fructicola]
MANLTLTIPLAPNQIHSSSKTLLGLPLELRTQIWRAALVSPPKHSLDHHADCHFRQNHTRTSIEPPAHLVLEPAVELVEPRLYPWDAPSQCRCAKRRGLNLLLASRQVHAEAAPLFWGENTFVFESSDEFTVAVGSRLREAYRRLLRSVYVGGFQEADKSLKTSVNLFTGEYLEQPIQRWCQFWGVLNQCRGLRELAIRPEVVRKHAVYLAKLRERLPELRKLEMTYVGKHKDRSCLYRRDWGSFRGWDRDVQRGVVFVRAAEEVELESLRGIDAKGCKEMFRGFTTNFCVYVDRIVRERFLGCEDEEGQLDLFEEGVKVNDAQREFVVGLPNGTETRIVFMGVPLSKETRVRLAMGRMERDRRLRAEGKRTPAEEKLYEAGRKKRELWKEMEADEEVRVRQRVLDGRRWRDEDRAEEERRAREAERAEVMRAADVARDERKIERKRGGKLGVVEVKDVVEEELVEVMGKARITKGAAKEETKTARKKKGMSRKKGGVSEIEEGLGDLDWDSWDPSGDGW